MIELKSLSRLRNGEFIQLIDNLLTIIKDRQPGVLKIQNQFSALENSYNSLNENFTVVRKNDLSKVLAELDEERDQLYQGLKYLIRAHAEYSPDDQQREVAISILNVLDSHGSRLTKLPYAEQTAAFNDIFDQVRDRQLENAINNTFHAQLFYGPLKTSNDKFDKAYVDRIKDYGKNSDENVKELRTEVEEALGEVVRFLNAYAVLEPTEQFIGAVKELDAALDLYFANIEKRSTASEAEVVEG